MHLQILRLNNFNKKCFVKFARFGEEEVAVVATPGHTEGCVTYVHSKVPFAKPQRYTSWEELVNFVSVVPPTSVPNFSNHFLRLDGLSLETPSLLEAVAEPTSRQDLLKKIDSFLV